jgi:hypothetical protein
MGPAWRILAARNQVPSPSMGEGQGWGCWRRVRPESRSAPTALALVRQRKHPLSNLSPIEGERLSG